MRRSAARSGRLDATMTSARVHYPLPTCKTRWAPSNRSWCSAGRPTSGRHRRAVGARRLSHGRPRRAPTRGHGPGRPTAARRRGRRDHHPLGRHRRRRPRRCGEGGVGRVRRSTSTAWCWRPACSASKSHLDDDPAAAAELAVANYAGPVSTLLHVAHRLRSRATARSSCSRRSPASGPARRTTSTARPRPGLDAFAQGLGDALVGSGVRVLVVRPGFVHSSMTEGHDAAPFATTPDEVAEAVADALARARRSSGSPARCAT